MSNNPSISNHLTRTAGILDSTVLDLVSSTALADFLAVRLAVNAHIAVFVWIIVKLQRHLKVNYSLNSQTWMHNSTTSFRQHWRCHWRGILCCLRLSVTCMIHIISDVVGIETWNEQWGLSYATFKQLPAKVVSTNIDPVVGLPGQNRNW